VLHEIPLLAALKIQLVADKAFAGFPPFCCLWNVQFALRQVRFFFKVVYGHFRVFIWSQLLMGTSQLLRLQHFVCSLVIQ